MPRLRRFAAALSLALSVPIIAQAQPFPIAPPGTEGLPVIVSAAGPVIATYLGNSAAFSDDLFLMLDAFGNPGDDGDTDNDLFIFNNQSSAIGTTVNLGSFGIGTELIFRLFVSNTSQNFFSGSPARNPDGLAHARVLENWEPQTTLVSFEDLLNNPEGAGGFNDLSFSFTNTATTVTPEPATFALLGLGLLVMVGVRRRMKDGLA